MEDFPHDSPHYAAKFKRASYLPGLAGLELGHEVVDGRVRGVRGPGLLAVRHVGAAVAPALRAAAYAPRAEGQLTF